MWKDITGYSRGDREREPNVWELRAGVLRITLVKKHIDFPDCWVYSCQPLFPQLVLGSVEDFTLEEAQAKVIDRVIDWLNKATRAIWDVTV